MPLLRLFISCSVFSSFGTASLQFQCSTTLLTVRPALFTCFLLHETAKQTTPLAACERRGVAALYEILCNSANVECIVLKTRSRLAFHTGTG